MVRTGKQDKITLYSTPTCGWCKVAKNYFIQKKVRFREIDVIRDKRAAKEMVKLSGQRSVPVIQINNHTIVGFDKFEINRLLGLR